MKKQTMGTTQNECTPPVMEGATAEEILAKHCFKKNVSGNVEYFESEVIAAMHEYASQFATLPGAGAGVAATELPSSELVLSENQTGSICACCLKDFKKCDCLKRFTKPTVVDTIKIDGVAVTEEELERMAEDAVSQLNKTINGLGDNVINGNFIMKAAKEYWIAGYKAKHQ